MSFLPKFEVPTARRPDVDPGPQHGGPCDPLTARTDDLALEPPIAVGVDEGDDTYFVVDYVGAEGTRAYTGRDGELVRWTDWNPDGPGDAPDKRWTVWSDPFAGSFYFGVDRRALAAGRVSVHHFEMRRIHVRVGSDGARRVENEPLRMSDPSVVDGWVARFGPAIELEYLARTELDDWIVVTRYKADHAPALVRAFVGPSNAVREVDDVTSSRQMDGHEARVVFVRNGLVGSAHFPIRCDDYRPELPRGRDGWFPTCPGELNFDGRIIGFENLGDQRQLARKLRYECAEPR